MASWQAISVWFAFDFAIIVTDTVVTALKGVAV
jgi:hypothetical protein